MRDLLDFRLPPFARISWVSDPAQRYWAPRLERAAHTWASIEAASAVRGLRDCALVAGDRRLPGDEEMEAAGLTAVLIEKPGEAMPGPAVGPSVVLGQEARVERLLEAWRECDTGTVGRLLGYPACCIEAFAATYADARVWREPWAWLGDLSEQEIDGTPLTNVLLAPLGLRLVPHVPCEPGCSASLELADRFAELGSDLGLSEEVEELRSILGWPVEWSALHGIAQIKTPIFRMGTDVAATGGTYRIRLRGRVQPAEAATGLAFPYRRPRRRLVRDAAGWGAGIGNPIRILQSDEGPDSDRR